MPWRGLTVIGDEPERGPLNPGFKAGSSCARSEDDVKICLFSDLS